MKRLCVQAAPCAQQMGTGQQRIGFALPSSIKRLSRRLRVVQVITCSSLKTQLKMSKYNNDPTLTHPKMLVENEQISADVSCGANHGPLHVFSN